MVGTESAFGTSNAMSRAGAVGVTQLMPDTARDMGLHVPKEAGTNSNPNLNYIPGPDDERMDNEKALEASAKYVKGLLKHYNNDPVLAYASYNWGQGNMDKYLAGSLNTIPDETEEYIKKIFHTSLSQYIQSKGLRKQ
ncbi:MAG TPA: lytic transglycosylase domain-containing protein, partial [Tissierellaceae bacterium]|nr:lytic transglycosylase domain-containing protein [Tissierellaceae bacterium]